MTVNLSQPMRNMSVSQRQMCEIAKAISYNSQVIVLDEPTSSLTVQEVKKLFEMMRMLKEQGIALVYISHKMDEIFEICDEISVLRDGNLVMTKRAQDTNMNELIAAMVGRSLESRFPTVDNTPGEPILSIRNLSTKYAPRLQDVSFDVREGEIFGLYGLVGAGRTELLETIFGVRTRAAGRVYFKNRLMNFNSAREAIDHGFAMITEERKANGLFLKCDLTFNTTTAKGIHLLTMTNILWAIAAVIVVWFIWNKTTFGKNLYTVGRNPEAASVSGISVFKVTVGAFVMAGILYGFGSWLECIRMSGSGSASYGQGWEMDAIAACVVGGVSFTSGIGKISGVVTGVFIFTALTYSLTTLGIDTNLQFVFSGIIILVAVMLDCLKYVQKK